MSNLEMWGGFKPKKEKYDISRGQITMKSFAKLIMMAASAVLLLTTFAAADTPGAHPAYLHALTDLRHARAHLERMTPNARVDADEQRAIEEIDAAIGEALATHSVKDAASVVSAATGQPRRQVYARALQISAGREK